jgi:hypothetical protein
MGIIISSGPNALKLSTAVIYKCSYKITGLVPVEPFQLILEKHFKVAPLKVMLLDLTNKH